MASYLIYHFIFVSNINENSFIKPICYPNFKTRFKVHIYFSEQIRRGAPRATLSKQAERLQPLGDKKSAGE